MNITEFLEARIAEDEAGARAALDPERPGTHWHWVTNQTDTPVPPGDIDEALNYQNLSLRTVEEFPTDVGPLPAFLIADIDEMNPGAGAHIVRHDPARVLAECAAKRAIVANTAASNGLHADDLGFAYDDANYRDVRALAAVYADHPDYQQEWAL